MTNEQILEREFNLLRVDLIAKYDELGMRASGDFANSLAVNVKGLTAVLSGNAYAEQLEDGRLPTTGGNQGGKKLTEIILDWINTKGIKPLEPKMALTTLAFLIARKIHREGWDRRNHGGVELISTVITPERVQQIIDKVSEFNVAQFTSQIKEMYLELA